MTILAHPRLMPLLAYVLVFPLWMEGRHLVVSAQSNSRYKYLGCFKDRKNDRALSHEMPERLSVEQCNAVCSSQNYKYSARQYKGQCFCGNSDDYGKHGERDTCGECNGPNVGGYLNCVYEDTQTGLSSTNLSPKVTPSTMTPPTQDPNSVTKYTYLGCYKDRKGDRALPKRIDGKLSVDQCNNACTSLNYKYSARQYQGQCWCGNGDYSKHGERDSCGDCDGPNVGGYLSCVYVGTHIGTPSPPTTPNPSPTNSVSQYTYKGCYKDKNSDRALPKKISGKYSVSQCQTQCSMSNFKYSGRQYTGECWCGNGQYWKHGSSTSCGACDGPDVGGYLNCVYEKTGTGLPPIAPPKAPSPSTPYSGPRFRYLGCYKDKSNDRALPLSIPGKYSLNQCQSQCTILNLKYSGRQYNGECWCGNDKYWKHGSSTACGACNGPNVGGYLSCVYEDTQKGSGPSDDYVPGLLNVYDPATGLLLAQGLSVRTLAEVNKPVALTDGKFSSLPFHLEPDGAAVFTKPDGGWYYVINSEQWNRDSGVFVLVFNSDGEIEDYVERLKGTYRNCAGGKTPWDTWISCEEYANGQCWQIDPSGVRAPEVTNIGEVIGGNFESFAYDDRSKQNPCFFVTEDHPRGALRRFCPNVPDGVLKWEILHQTDYTRTYLKLTPQGGNFGKFEWTSSKVEGENTAQAYFPNSEGIDRLDNFLFIVSKIKKRVVILNLDDGTYRWESTASRLFSGDQGDLDAEPDQIVRVLGGDNLFLTEDGGKTPGIYMRDVSGIYHTIVEGSDEIYKYDETVSLSFSPDGKRMYFGIQTKGKIFEVTRNDGLSFHHVSKDGRIRNLRSSLQEKSLPVHDLTLMLKFHTVPQT